MKNEDKKPPGVKIPERLTTAVDLSRTLRELKMLDDWLNQAALRTGGKQVTPPKTSATLEELASLNGVSLLDGAQRTKLIEDLTVFKEKAPKIHMSFAVEPSAVFLNQMINWLRTNVDSNILIEVGLQPTLAAGCTVRTVNKMFDLSLRHRFVESRPLLVKSIAEVTVDTLEQPAAAGQQAAVPAPEVPQAAASESPVPSTPAVPQTPETVQVPNLQEAAK